MKTLANLLIASALSVASATAQETLDGVFKAPQATTPYKEKKSPPLGKEAPNEIRGKKLKFRGASIQILKAHNPLQLINPFAPAKYGSGYDHVVRDPINGNGTGISTLSIEF